MKKTVRYGDATKSSSGTISRAATVAGTERSGPTGSICPGITCCRWGIRSGDNPLLIVSACRFCNEASNKTKWDVEGKSPEELLVMKAPFMLAVQAKYEEYWEAEIQLQATGYSSSAEESGRFEARIDRVAE